MRRRTALAAAAGLLAGCATIGRTTAGSVPAAAAVAGVREGATLAEVLTHLGAPLEWWLAPDGLLVVWRRQRYDFERVEIDPTRSLPLVQLEPTIGAALANLKLTFERGTLREDRLAVLFDRAGHVLAVAQRDGEGRRLR